MFIEIISREISKTPKMFGAWHLISVVATIIFAFIICFKLKNTNKSQNKIILFTVAGILLCFELLKEIILAYNNGNGWHYSWWTFPFQPCSICMYVIFFAACIPDKHEKILNWLYAFLATYGIFCGLSGVIIPSDLFATYTSIFVLFQSLFHHSILVLVGIYIIASKRIKLCNKNFLKASAIFIGACFIAIPLNIIIYKFVTTEIFNMMYVSPYFDCTLPIVSLVAGKISYYFYLPIYFIAFGLCAFAVMHIALIIQQIKKKVVKSPLS